jgi:hypothetical protein
MRQIDLRMTTEEKARQQIGTILIRDCWTVQDKPQMNLHAAEGIAFRQLPNEGWSMAEVERRLSVVEELSAPVAHARTKPTTDTGCLARRVPAGIYH